MCSFYPFMPALLKGVSHCCLRTVFWFWRAPHHQHESAGKAPLATVCALFQTVQWTSSGVGLKGVEWDVLGCEGEGKRAGEVAIPLVGRCRGVG